MKLAACSRTRGEAFGKSAHSRFGSCFSRCDDSYHRCGHANNQTSGGAAAALRTKSSDLGLRKPRAEGESIGLSAGVIAGRTSDQSRIFFAAQSRAERALGCLRCGIAVLNSRGRLRGGSSKRHGQRGFSRRKRDYFQRAPAAFRWRSNRRRLVMQSTRPPSCGGPPNILRRPVASRGTRTHKRRPTLRARPVSSDPRVLPPTS
jgi:hypothetical protein